MRLEATEQDLNLHAEDRRVPSPSFTFTLLRRFATLACVSLLSEGFPQRQPVEAPSAD